MAGYDNDWRRRGRGFRGQDRSQWARPRGQDYDRTAAGEYGMEHPSGGYPFGTGYPSRPEESPRFRAGGTGYDFGYQGGEFGRPVNAPDFGTRGSYGQPPLGRSGQRASRGGFRASMSPYGQGSADFGGREHRHYGHTPGDRWPSHETGFSGPMADDEVLESVRENLFQDSYIDPERIRVDVDRGIVTLRGEVDDFLEARYAWDDAWESPGVRGVINNLTVRTDRASDEMAMPQTGGDDQAPGGPSRR